ncbi:helix-turn-helix domain-containing protein [Dokdonella sp. MW10]|uniref:helix-turn-helix domain-containing protein n=1 Tax=Dokdonella sp. MW10 TaxID=2992926 RepID=UPI003F7F2C51
MAKTIHRPEYRRLLDALRQRRVDLGLSQVAVARELGWPQQKLSSAEACARRLDVLEYLELSRVLQLSPNRAIALAMRELSS